MKNETEYHQIICYSCKKYLEYDAGAQFVHCGNCNALNSVQIRNLNGARVSLFI